MKYHEAVNKGGKKRGWEEMGRWKGERKGRKGKKEMQSNRLGYIAVSDYTQIIYFRLYTSDYTQMIIQIIIIHLDPQGIGSRTFLGYQNL